MRIEREHASTPKDRYRGIPRCFDALSMWIASHISHEDNERGPVTSGPFAVSTSFLSLSVGICPKRSCSCLKVTEPIP